MLQEAFNGLAKKFIWANPTFKGKLKSNQVFEEIRTNKKVYKSINIIITINKNNPHDFWQLK